MNRYPRKLVATASTLVGMLASFEVFAGDTLVLINYQPVAHTVPALSEMALLVFGFLLAVIAFRVLRAHPSSKPFASLVAVGVLALSAASEHKFIIDAWAVGSYEFNLPSGGSVSIPNADHGVELTIHNTSGVTQSIGSFSYQSSYRAVATTGSPRCTTNLEVSNSGSCYVKFQ